MSADMTLRAGVLGFPVAQSLSPKLHTHWLNMLGIDGSYEAIEVSPGMLSKAFNQLPKQGFRGWNITVPHKEEAYRLVHERDAAAQAIGAVNTVVVRPDGTLLGMNTDAYGFITNIKSKAGELTPYRKKACVIGAGGAARAVVKALVDDGFERIVVLNRTLDRAEELAADMGKPVKAVSWDETAKALSDATLLVNTTSLGMEGEPPLLLSLDSLPKNALVADIVYKPLITPLLAQAQARGNITVTGLGMLIHQAVPGFTAWFGEEPPLEADLEQWLLA